MLTIQELLFNRGLDRKAKVKLVRHKDSRRNLKVKASGRKDSDLNLYDLYRYNKKAFFDYQRSQRRDVFKEVKYIVSFIGEKGRRSRFVGVYKILGKGVFRKNHFWYKMKELTGFEDMKEKVIIDWGSAPIVWLQRIENEKEIVEIHPGLHFQQFTDYFDFILDFKELQEIVNKEYSDWKRMLSATKGVYLISDSKTGKLYVGSAYGDDGIWGRWKSYVGTKGHGGNKMLRELVKKDSNYAVNFRFSILMLLSRTETNDQVREKEKLFKRKLGSNAFGLNNN